MQWVRVARALGATTFEDVWSSLQRADRTAQRRELDLHVRRLTPRAESRIANRLSTGSIWVAAPHSACARSRPLQNL